jgi:mannose-6-phosphate isomerase-like protein (cupin superfamily)
MPARRDEAEGSGEAAAWTVLGHRVRLRAAGPGGAWSLFEVEAEAGGPPPHRHLFDELFLVREGALEVLVGERWIGCGPGGQVHVPSWAVHTYRPGPGGVRMDVLATPAGLERFFAELAASVPGLPPDPARLLEVMHRHGLELAVPSGG